MLFDLCCSPENSVPLKTMILIEGERKRERERVGEAATITQNTMCQELGGKDPPSLEQCHSVKVTAEMSKR
jgi:hypothetical protein